MTEDVITYTNRRGVSIGGLVRRRATTSSSPTPSDPGYFWLAENETQAIRASLGYLTNNVVPLNELGGALATDNNDRTFDGSHVDADANTISLPRIATVNNTFELGQAVVFHAPSVEFTSGDVQNNIRSWISARLIGFRHRRPGDLRRRRPPGEHADGDSWRTARPTTSSPWMNDHIRLSETPGGTCHSC